MYYRITLQTPVTTLSEELQSNQVEAQDKAFEMLSDHGRQGKAVIERRHSPYFGEYKHYMTCSYLDHQ